MTPIEVPRSSDLPTHVPSERERADLELLRLGALVPWEGFGGPDSLVTLTVPSHLAYEALDAGGLTLLDVEGVAQATLCAVDSYEAGPGLVGLVGGVEPLPYDGSAPFGRLRLSPESVRASCGDGYLLVPVERPLTQSDLATVATKAGESGVVLLVLYGPGKGQLAASALVRATLAAAASLPRASVVVAPIFPRTCAVMEEEQPGLRDTALIRHVVDNYAAADVAWPTGEGPLSDEVAAVVSRAGSVGGRRGLVLFFTGLSGSGKSTVARAVQDVLLECHDREITSLDGDVVRRNLSEGLGFSAEDRDRNIRRIGWVAAEIARHGGLAVASPIAPFDSTRRHVRALVTAAGGSFVLVHVATPLEECERRDRKGLYARARSGEIPDFTGISSPYEVPADAEVRIDTAHLRVAEAAQAVIEHLATGGYLTGGKPA